MRHSLLQGCHVIRMAVIEECLKVVSPTLAMTGWLTRPHMIVYVSYWMTYARMVDPWQSEVKKVVGPFWKQP